MDDNSTTYCPTYIVRTHSWIHRKPSPAYVHVFGILEEECSRIMCTTSTHAELQKLLRPHIIFIPHSFHHFFIFISWYSMQYTRVA